MSPAFYGKVAVVVIIVLALIWVAFKDLQRVRIVFKGGHVETLWLTNMKVYTAPDGHITKLEWVRHWSARKRMLDITLNEIAGIFCR